MPETLILVPETVGDALELTGINNDYLNRTKRQMWLYEIKKLQHNKSNVHLIKESAHRMGENLCQLYIWQGISN
jgi:hypothetical protein